MAETYSPPTGAEIAVHKRAGGDGEMWSFMTGEWTIDLRSNPDYWLDPIRRDVPHPGYRLAPIPPRVESVPCSDAFGRIEFSSRKRIVGVRVLDENDGVWQYLRSGDSPDAWRWSEPYGNLCSDSRPRNTVECLVVDQ